MPCSRADSYLPSAPAAEISPAAARAGFHSWTLKLLRQTSPLAVFVNRRRAETFGPSGLRHGKVISTGLKASMWARRDSATEGGKGTSRSLLHFGGANT